MHHGPNYHFYMCVEAGVGGFNMFLALEGKNSVQTEPCDHFRRGQGKPVLQHALNEIQASKTSDQTTK